ncbi:hypothetical protein ACFWG0_03140 [Streptomyces yangpuensis]|uniref:hypothetical protein n=1 Tax=Streptomyces yangpuensis TaxID=1648182 RepID=UPI00364E1F58
MSTADDDHIALDLLDAHLEHLSASAAPSWSCGGAAAVRAGLAVTGVHRFITGEYINGLDLCEELGLIAVSDEEVGVCWSVGAY